MSAGAAFVAALISSRQRRVAVVTPEPEPVALAVEPVTA